MYCVDDHVCGGQIPYREDYKQIRELGFRIVISLVEDWEYMYYADMSPQEVLDEAARNDLIVLRFPTRDGYAPDEETLLRICEIINNNVKQCRKVYVHCVGGLGRTPTVLAAYLVYSRGLSAEDALREVMKVNPEMSITEDQYYSLKSFELMLGKEKHVKKSEIGHNA